jgi:hypothetical protein
MKQTFNLNDRVQLGMAKQEVKARARQMRKPERDALLRANGWEFARIDKGRVYWRRGNSGKEVEISDATRRLIWFLMCRDGEIIRTPIGANDEQTSSNIPR